MKWRQGTWRWVKTVAVTKWVETDSDEENHKYNGKISTATCLLSNMRNDHLRACIPPLEGLCTSYTSWSCNLATDHRACQCSDKEILNRTPQLAMRTFHVLKSLSSQAAIMLRMSTQTLSSFFFSTSHKVKK